MIQSGDYGEWWNVVTLIRNAFPRLRDLDTWSPVGITVGKGYGSFKFCWKKYITEGGLSIHTVSFLRLKRGSMDL